MDVPDIVWIVVGKQIREAEPYHGAVIGGAVCIDTDSGPVYIRKGRWFKTKRAAQLALSRKRRLKA